MNCCFLLFVLKIFLFFICLGVYFVTAVQFHALEKNKCWDKVYVSDELKEMMSASRKRSKKPDAEVDALQGRPPKK